MVLLIYSCKETYMPKPHGYFRISFPEKQYNSYESDFPYTFQFPDYSKIELIDADSCWINITFPDYNAKIYITYRTIDNNLSTLLEQSRKFSYNHTSKADEISESLTINWNKRVFGTQYEIKGDVASSLQFYLTDSLQHFMRASLYFNERPNQDSIAPVLNFIKEDVEKLIESFEWRN